MHGKLQICPHRANTDGCREHLEDLYKANEQCHWKLARLEQQQQQRDNNIQQQQQQQIQNINRLNANCKNATAAHVADATFWRRVEYWISTIIMLTIAGLLRRH